MLKKRNCSVLIGAGSVCRLIAQPSTSTANMIPGKKQANPQSVSIILDWLEKATAAKLDANANDVIASWASAAHLKASTILLGVFQVREPLMYYRVVPR